MSRRSLASWASWTFCASLVAASAAFNAAHADTLNVNVSGIQSLGETPDAGNQSFSYFIGAGASVVSIAYDVSLQANSPSWLSEIGVAISDSSGLNGLYLFPGFGSNAAGTQRFTGTVTLTGPLNVTTGADGLLKLEFFESAGDGLNPDGVWLSGSLLIEHVPGVPEPETYAMLLAGMGLIALVRRRHMVGRDASTS